MMKPNLFQLLTEFEVWQNGHPLNEQRLAQHDLVLGHLARLYGGLSWDAQHFGLVEPLSVSCDETEGGPIALSELLAVTCTGKLLVCATAEIPVCEHPTGNQGLFALAQPVPMSPALQQTWPEFPLYQVQLEWRAWSAGMTDIVKTGEGLPLGRLTAAGQWDAAYRPPVLRLMADARLLQQAHEVQNALAKVTSRDGRVAELSLQLRQTDWTANSPQAFWQSHCQCLVALKNHPTLAADSDYHAKVSALVSSAEPLPWFFDKRLVSLGSLWAEIDKRLYKEADRHKSMAQLMKRVTRLAKRDERVADLSLQLRQTDWTQASPQAFWQSHCQCLVALKTHPKLAGDANYQASVATLLSASFSPFMIGDGLEPLRLGWKSVEQGLEKAEQPAPKPRRVVSLGWYAASMVALVLLLGAGLVYQSDQSEQSLKELKADFAHQLAALNLQLTTADHKQADTTDKLEKRLTAVDQQQADTLGLLSEQIANLKSEQAQTAKTLRTDFTALDKKQANTLSQLSEQLASLKSEQAKTADQLSKHQHDNLSKQLTTVNQKIDELSQQLTDLDWFIPGKVVHDQGKVILHDRLKDGSEGPAMVVIPAGTFRMGDLQGGGDSDEQPVHTVSVKRFAMGRYEVTFAEYDKFAEATGRTKPDDEGWGRGNRPVINVSWEDVTAYADWLSEQTGHQYRLPTEAEWEYAARAGTETKYWWGNEIGSNQANCSNSSCGDSFDYTAPVGSFAANQFGLFDTVGNVWEWTCSEYEGKYAGKEQRCAKEASLFVLRGGSWDGGTGGARAANRFRWSRSERGWNLGARLARIVNP